MAGTVEILAVDNERKRLDGLLDEVSEVFPRARLHGETDPLAAARWAKELRAGGKSLRYAFLEISMEGMDGLTLARELAALHPGVRLIFCTDRKEYALDAMRLYARGYLLRPVRASDIMRTLDELADGWREELREDAPEISARVFGTFELLVDGRAVSFGRGKARELLAYLVDRRGASVTTRQIALVLWEDKPYDRTRKNAVTRTVSLLRRALAAAGAEEILIRSRNHLAVDTSKLRCDAWNGESGGRGSGGEYLAEYPWAEHALGSARQKEKERPE